MIASRLSAINYSKICNLTKCQIPVLNSICKKDFNSMATIYNKKSIIIGSENDNSALSSLTSMPLSSTSAITQRYYSTPVKKATTDKDIEESKKILIRYTFKAIAFMWDLTKIIIHYARIIFEKIYYSKIVQRYVKDFQNKLEEARKN